MATKKKFKTFTVTGGTVFQKVAGEMKPFTKGMKIKLAVDDDGLPTSKGIRSRVEGARRRVVKSDETVTDPAE
jgi:hypothetical protein